MGALKPHKIPKEDLAQVKEIYERVEGREERFELNLYIAGEEVEGDTEIGVETEGSSA